MANGTANGTARYPGKGTAKDPAQGSSFLALVTALLMVSCSSTPSHQRTPASTGGSLAQIQIENLNIGAVHEKQRVGLFLQNPEIKPKACVLYLEGLSDSFFNHQNLFSDLNRAGYRVLSFDYLGQGGSEGELSQMRVDSRLNQPFMTGQEFEISEQAKWVWSHFQGACRNSPKLVIGTNVGGLSAFKLAKEKWADAVILLSPSLSPTYCIHEVSDRLVDRCNSDEVLPLEVPLASREPGSVPELAFEPPRPATLDEAKGFVINLVSTAYLRAPRWRVSKNGTSGLVFLPGVDDPELDREEARRILIHNAPDFTLISFEEARGNLDQERPEISTRLRRRLIKFLDSKLVSNLDSNLPQK